MPFPTTGILDAFTRADENPLANSTWSGPIISGQPQLRLVSNQLAGPSSGTFGESYWSAATFGADSEAYFDTVPVYSASRIDVFLRVANPGVASAVDGYMIVANDSTSLAQIWRYDNSVATKLGADISQTWTDGDGFGADVVGSTITVYRKSAGSWSSLGTRTDTTYTAAGYIGAQCQNSGVRADDFGGGTVVVAGGAPSQLTTLGIG